MSRHFMQAYMNFKFPEQAKSTDDGSDHLSALLFGINMLMHNECLNGVAADRYFKPSQEKEEDLNNYSDRLPGGL